MLADWNIPVATVMTIVLATMMPQRLQRLQGAAEACGVLGMQLFFAATGASGRYDACVGTFLLCVHLVSDAVIAWWCGGV